LLYGVIVKRKRKRFEFDVALSFAGENRRVVKKLATMLVQAGADVFYDEYKQATLWGKDLYQHLQDIYQNRARYCVVFVSKNYIKKHWAKHELKNAQARAFASHREYILPLRMDSTVLPGLPATVGYLDLKKHDLEEIAVLLLEKLRIPLGDLGEEVARAKWEGDMVALPDRRVKAEPKGRIENARRKPPGRAAYRGCGSPSDAPSRGAGRSGIPSVPPRDFRI
jgi:TIR domain